MILSSCASVNSNTAVVTISSQPAGAMIYEGQKAWGMSPVAVNFNITAPNGYITTTSFTAVWASGARASQNWNVQGGNSYSVSISRPVDAAGLDLDLAQAMKIEQMNAQKQQANQNAAIQLLINQQQQQQLLVPRPPVRTNCYTNGSYTNCTSQ